MKFFLGRQLSGRQLLNLVAICIIALVGTLLMLQTFAATSTASTEAEQGTVAGDAAKCTDASASQGSYVRFGTTSCKTYTNPVKSSTADPGVLLWENKYYMVSTSGDNPWFGISVSDNLIDWQSTGKNVFNGPGTHPWGKDRFWAPEIHRVGNGFAVYYSASDNTGRLVVGVATASNILGPYTDLGRPLVRNGSFGVIDVNFFRDDDGKQYLFWKEDSGSTRIFGQEIDQAGTGFIGSTVEVLRQSLNWEGSKGIEGPWMAKKDGMYYIYYSGELYLSDRYALGVARSSSPLGTFTKKGDPILKSGSRWKGPGHNSTAKVGDTDYMIYHAYDTIAGQGSRVALVDKITWVNGWPTVGNGLPTQTAQPYPR